MRVVVEMSEEAYDWLKNGFPDEIDAKYAVEAIQEGIPLPQNLTNGDMIKAMFPKEEIYESDSACVYVGAVMRFDTAWWNAPYERSTDADSD